MAGTSFSVPQISQADMTTFHDTHFSQLATNNFQAHFLRPDHPSHDTTYHVTETNTHITDDGEYYEEEDDGLGYYPDGVKRTLTDEQIAIFRHSELEALRRTRESSETKKNTTKNTAQEDAAHEHESEEEGEVSSPTPSAATATTKKNKKRKRGKVKKNKANAGEEPIDLRKRTWDVVDTGLSSLDYGEEEQEPVAASTIQRRRISYDD
ncbi:uncharacterized protein C8A04DRAFT_13735 [Dichotomopilus funicola]|uniref:Uncharacterized protein n=1 Tax=Dichotomopilus funicola TaxID=1934379 RepID=A0AAN6UZ26_9PEZI|nr:hypothetical protein C8A04DRAFT_13735 [Dichotomopilus funicola]